MLHYFIPCLENIYILQSLFQGGFGIWLAATYAFLADISPPNQLAFRMGMLHLTSGLAKPIGPPIGAFLYKTGNYLIISKNTSFFVLTKVTAGLLIFIYNVICKHYRWLHSSLWNCVRSHGFGCYTPILEN